MIFAKAPLAGRVKTRLCLSDSDAQMLHEAFVQDVITRSRGPWQQTLWTTDAEHPFFATFQLPVHAQVGTSLGQRLSHAFAESLKAFERVVVIGTDAPHLPANHITNAFTALDANDVVIGPSCDGGYYLLGMRRMMPDIFHSEMDWGGEDIFTQTLSILGNHGYSPSVLPFWFDVDRPADLRRLSVWPDLDQLPATQHALKQLGPLALGDLP